MFFNEDICPAMQGIWKVRGRMNRSAPDMKKQQGRISCKRRHKMENRELLNILRLILLGAAVAVGGLFFRICSDIF